MTYDLISKYRRQLMGIAIITILFCHLEEACNVHDVEVSIFAKLFSKGTCGVDLFFILSGFGCFYSFKTRNNNVVDFYKRRISKIIPTYCAICIPYWIIRDLIIDKTSIKTFLLDFSTISFFTSGIKRFWFVAAILVFYFCFPLLYGFFFKKNKSTDKRIIVTILAFVLLNIFIYMITDNYHYYSIMIGRIPSFVIGVWMGYKSFSSERIKPNYLFCTIIIYTVLLILNRIPRVGVHCKALFHYYHMTLIGLLVIFFSVFILKKINNNTLNSILGVLGEITLEIYLFHSALKNLFNYPYRFVTYFFCCVLLPLLFAFCIHFIKKYIKNHRIS